MKKINQLLMLAVFVMYGCDNLVNSIKEDNINIVTSISSEEIARSPVLDEDGKGNFANGDIFSLVVSNPEKNSVINDYIVGDSDLSWKDLNISSSNGKVCFSACYPKQEIKNGKFIFDLVSAIEKDLLIAQTRDIAVNSQDPVFLSFKHAMHKLEIVYKADTDMNIDTKCTALSSCEMDMIGNNLKAISDKKTTFQQSGKNVSFLLVPQNTSDINLDITYGDNAKTYALNELIKDYSTLDSGKKFTLVLNIKNGDIQIENPVIGNWGSQGTADGNVII